MPCSIMPGRLNSPIARLAAFAMPVALCAAHPAGAMQEPAPKQASNVEAPCDPEVCGKGKLSAEQLREDRAITYRLNREELALVQRRDAQYAEQRRRNDEALRAYEEALADHERKMAQWREAVRRCQAGEVEYCGG